jgi:hypothetical protein
MSTVGQLAQAGWTLKEVAGDGNCFYRGLAYLLTGSDGNHQAAREAVARQFKSGHEYHRRLGFEQADLDELSMKMERAGEDVTDAGLTAAAEMAGRPLQIYMKDTRGGGAGFITVPTRIDRAGRDAEVAPPLRFLFYEHPDYERQREAATAAAARLVPHSAEHAEALRQLNAMSGGHYDPLRPLQATEAGGSSGAAAVARAEAEQNAARHTYQWSN